MRLPTLFLVITTGLLLHIPMSFCQDDKYEDCAKLFQCGSLENVGYPFYGEGRPGNCGHRGFELKCVSDVPLIRMRSVTYRVLAANLTGEVLAVARNDLWEDICLPSLHNTTLDLNIFNYSTRYPNITIFYDCSIISGVQFSPPNQFCIHNGGNNFSFYLTMDEPFSNYESRLVCEDNITVPVNLAAFPSIADLRSSVNKLRAALNGGFELDWFADDIPCSECDQSGGRCGHDAFSGLFICYCAGGTYHPSNCSKVQTSNNSSSSRDGQNPSWERNNSSSSRDNQNSGGERNNSSSSMDRQNSSRERNNSNSSISVFFKFMIAASVMSAIIILLIIAFCYHRRRCFLLHCNRNEDGRKNDQNIEAFMKHWDSIAIKQYSYPEIKKITNSFGEKLGQGGYGSVYKGKLPDGCQVAVKVLRETKGDCQGFINEVSSICRTSHVNIVTLLGFCYNRRKALVYEFMPNGSLDKFINRNRLQNSNNILEWKILYQIAVGIARGLEYLHRGCKTRIVHFDIKPHNILVDEDFCPKKSDFGLAKISEKKESILSSLTARGTVGYIAPEVFFRHFGGVSHKSDVYSYGMMVLEMVGVRKNVVEVERSSDVYFPEWIYEHLELGKDLNIQAITSQEDEEMSKKMMLVGLWCIQTNPSGRPSISNVVEMLEGSLHSLQIPPKPFPYSPKRSPQHPSASLSDTEAEIVINE